MNQIGSIVWDVALKTSGLLPGDDISWLIEEMEAKYIAIKSDDPIYEQVKALIDKNREPRP